MFQFVLIYLMIQWFAMNLLGFKVKRNSYAMKEIRKIRHYSLFSVMILLSLLVLESLDFFESLLLMILTIGLGGAVFLFILFYSIMVLGIILWKSLELKNESDNLFIFTCCLLFLPIGFPFLREKL